MSFFILMEILFYFICSFKFLFDGRMQFLFCLIYILLNPYEKHVCIACQNIILITEKELCKKWVCFHLSCSLPSVFTIHFINSGTIHLLLLCSHWPCCLAHSSENSFWVSQIPFQTSHRTLLLESFVIYLYLAGFVCQLDTS